MKETSASKMVSRYENISAITKCEGDKRIRMQNMGMKSS